MPVNINFLPDIITSRANPLLIKVGKLEDKKHRDADGIFRFDGIKLFCEAVKCGAEIEYVFVRESAKDRVLSSLEGHPEIAENLGKSGQFVLLGDSAFDKISPEKSPEGIICVAKYVDNFKKTDKIEGKDVQGKAVIVESVRDPGNLGTILRCADAFGIDHVILSSDCADVFSPKTLRGAMGAVFRKNMTVCSDLCATVKALKADGRRVLATALHRDSLKLGDFELKPADIFVIGNEGHGISPELISACGETVFIPMCGGAESLNAGVAASICMWEISKL